MKRDAPFYPVPKPGDRLVVELWRGGVPLFLIDRELGSLPAFPVSEAERAIAAAWKGSEKVVQWHPTTGRPHTNLDLGMYREHLRGETIAAIAQAHDLDDRTVRRRLAKARAFLKAVEEKRSRRTETPPK